MINKLPWNDLEQNSLKLLIIQNEWDWNEISVQCTTDDRRHIQW